MLVLVIDYTKSVGNIYALIYSDEVKTPDDIFRQYEKANFMMRIDEKQNPKTWKCATVSSNELIQLRKIRNIVRKGRVESIEIDKIIFKDGRYE